MKTPFDLLGGMLHPGRALAVAKQFQVLGLNPIKLGIYYVELLSDSRYRHHIDRVTKEARNADPDDRLGGWISDFEGTVLYAIVRLTKPDIVIETGVGPGGSSALILNALAKNRKGHLYSIDLPGRDAIVYPTIGRTYNIHVPSGFDVGWLVPPWLQPRWSLILGDSRDVLPSLLKNIGPADMFLHDSLHTDEHIFFELSLALPHLKPKGTLLCDDVNETWSTAFVEFCNSREIPFMVVGDRLGVARGF